MSEGVNTDYESETELRGDGAKKTGKITALKRL